MSPILYFSLMAGTAPLIAATIPLYLFKNGINPRTFQTLLGLSAGLLFAIATLELIPEAFEMIELANESVIQKRNLLDSSSLAVKLESEGLVQNFDVERDEDSHGHDHGEEANSKIAMIGLGAGYLFLVMLEQAMSGHGHSHSHSHSHTHTHEEEVHII